MRILLGIIFSILPLFANAQYFQDSCQKSCVLNSECGIGGVCSQGNCSYQAAYCNDERWSVNSRGETRDCKQYRCDTNSGLCLREAKNSQDCLFGYVYDGGKNCLPSVQCNSADPSCQTLLDRWQAARNEYENSFPEPKPVQLSCISCQADADCPSSQMCWNNRCADNRPYCLADSNGSFNQVSNGQKTSCGKFACEQVTGLCLNSCNGDNDCIHGTKCLNRLCQ